MKMIKNYGSKNYIILTQTLQPNQYKGEKIDIYLYDIKPYINDKLWKDYYEININWENIVKLEKFIKKLRQVEKDLCIELQITGYDYEENVKFDSIYDELIYLGFTILND